MADDLRNAAATVRKLELPPAVAAVLQALQKAGHEAFVVGGCVRDALMGRPPHDWDICTAATPQQVMACFAGETVVPTGLAHGTVTLVRSGVPYEITTYRVEGNYADHRRPDSVVFTRHIEEDLSRRDFTINAIAYAPGAGFVDPFGGRRAIAEKSLACVGEPACRFEEDALRVLRGLRFAATLGFGVQEQTAAALLQSAPLLLHIAAERIGAELCGMLVGAGIGPVLQQFAGAVAVVLPELQPTFGFEQHSRYHNRDVWGHTVAAVAAAAPVLPVRLALLLHDVAKPACFTQDAGGAGHFYDHAKKGAVVADAALQRLRLPAALCERVVLLVARHDVAIPAEPKPVRRWLAKLGPEAFFELMQVKEGDARAHAPAYQAGALAHVEAVRAVAKQELQQNACLSLKQLAVGGRDLLAEGMQPGPAVGRVLHALLDAVVEGELPNEKAALLRAAPRMADEDGLHEAERADSHL